MAAVRSKFKAADKLAFAGELGAVYSRGGTVFRVWSPSAERVELRLYESGTAPEPFFSADMKKIGCGAWEYSRSGDLDGVYYTYSVTIMGTTRETADIYSVSASADGQRGMVADMERAAPDGWENIAPVRLSSPADTVIYELSVRDFSMDESADFTHRGKFLAFSESGVTCGGKPVGLEYVRSLGVTHIQLMPVFDFESNGGYNWGYNPRLMMAPEGTYSSDPNDGHARIRELRQLIMAAHEMGLGVTADVVYNHSFSADESPFGRTFPHYYYRGSGKYSNGSGCGNEFASERKMARKFIKDSLCFLAREYKLDGFRFDLMGLLDIKTLNECAEALRAINPDILLYGEGWTGGASPMPENLRAMKKNARSVPCFAMFGDDFRDAVKGSVFNARDRGYVSGAADTERAEMIKSGLAGGVFHPEINISKERLWTDDPLQCINYVECHDNLTLADKLALSMPEADKARRIAADRMTAALVIFSQGIPFIQAGQEYLRSKPLGEGFDGNSYCSPDSVNSLKWSKIIENADTVEYYRGLIALRRKFPQFRLRTSDEIRSQLTFADLGGGAFAEMPGGGLALFVNPTDEPLRVVLGGACEVYADAERASDEPIYRIDDIAQISPVSVLLVRKIAQERKMREYTVTRIVEPDFGCEGLPEGGERMDEVRLRGADGGELLLSVSDELLYKMGVDEGSRVLSDGKSIFTMEEQI